MDIQFGTDFMICWLLWLYVFNTFTAVSTFCWNTELLVYFYISLLFLFQICIHYTCITCTCIARSFYNSQLKSFWNVYRNSWHIGRRCSADNSKANYYHMLCHYTRHFICNGLFEPSTMGWRTLGLNLQWTGVPTRSSQKSSAKHLINQDISTGLMAQRKI